MNPDIEIQELPTGDVQVSLIEKIPGSDSKQVVNIVMKPSSLLLLAAWIAQHERNQLSLQEPEPSMFDQGNMQKNPWGEYPNANLSPETD